MTACDRCLWRTTLVAALVPSIGRTEGRIDVLRPLLGLGDRDLVEALRARALARAVRSGFSARAARERCERGGLVPICRCDAAYPAALRDLGADAPAILHVRGAARLEALLAEPAVSIVGARRASAYGLEVARALGRGLSVARVTVVSGMALGVDSAAHAGALEGGGATIAVLAGGADVPYPASKRALHRRIAECGAVVSELPPGFVAHRWSFPARNRIIAALGRVTLVVEGVERSGSLITARVARDLGRDVAAVPGQVTAPQAAGPNALLRDGAHVITGVQDALDVACGVGARQAPGPDAALDPALRTLLDAVAGGRDTLAALARTPEEADRAMIGLAELELLGRVRRVTGGRYVSIPA